MKGAKSQASAANSNTMDHGRNADNTVAVEIERTSI
ncbi:hypothetical protein ACHAXH_007771 [Discostella pseudostelligera]